MPALIVSGLFWVGVIWLMQSISRLVEMLPLLIAIVLIVLAIRGLVFLATRDDPRSSKGLDGSNLGYPTGLGSVSLGRPRVSPDRYVPPLALAGTVATQVANPTRNLFVHSCKPPTRGLVIDPIALEKILSGRKSMELRGQHNRQLGAIGLIPKGSGKVVGVAEIIESVGPMTFEEFVRRAPEHGVERERMRQVYEKGWKYGWRLSKVRRLRDPVPYVHKGMSRVVLDASVIEAIGRQLKSG